MGAAVHALCLAPHSSGVHCATIKSNQGHLEAAAATAGLSSLSLLALASTLHAMPCSFLKINAHLRSLDLNLFHFQTDFVSLSKPVQGRLSSFGYSGTIAHAVLSIETRS